jgi:putative ABC transport system permease protein
MNLFSIAWKSIRQRALASSLTALSVALGVALMVMVLVINGTVTRMFSQSATGYHLIVGAKGSPLQLGDTTEDGRFRIVGTIPEYFEVEYIPEKKFQFSQGRALTGGFEAVVGARVARAYGWTLGSEFPIAHGGNLADVHAEKFQVVGILAPTGTPNDRAVFIHFDGFYSIAGHEKPVEEARAEEEARQAGDAPIILPNGGSKTTGPLRVRAAQPGDQPKPPPAPQQSVKEVASEQKQVTAILLQMKSDTLAYLYAPRINKAPVAQAVNPIAQISRLLNDLVGNVRTMLLVLTGLIIIVSGISIFVSIYNSMADRKREIAIMRALGARRGTVFSIIVAEAVLLCVLGWIVGTALGHALVFLAAPIVEARSDVLINPWSFEKEELLLLPVILGLSILVGLLPGWTAYRVDVARGLQE